MGLDPEWWGAGRSGLDLERQWRGEVGLHPEWLWGELSRAGPREDRVRLDPEQWAGGRVGPDLEWQGRA